MSASKGTSMLDAPRASSWAPKWIAVAGAFVVHAAVALVATQADERVPSPAPAAQVTQLMDVELPPPPETPPPPAPAPPAPEVKRTPPPTEKPPEATPAAPPPAAAQAGQVLEAQTDDTAQKTDETIVTGQGDKFAGGTTDSTGTAKQAVRDPNARGNVENGNGIDPLGDRSRPPHLADGGSWDCPFPAEADEVGVDRAVVSLRVEVAADGRVTRVSVANDPGHGFGREAKRCAFGKRWSAGLDRAGAAVSTFALVNVEFER